MAAHSYASMSVNLQQRQLLHNIVFNICKFILEFSLANRNRVAQCEVEYPSSIIIPLSVYPKLSLSIIHEYCPKIGRCFSRCAFTFFQTRIQRPWDTLDGVFWDNIVAGFPNSPLNQKRILLIDLAVGNIRVIQLIN